MTTPDPRAEHRAYHAAYVRHLNRCREAGLGRQCQTCFDLLRDADAESWRNAAERPASRAAGAGAGS